MAKAKLRRELGLFQVTLAGIGIIVGAGIYALIGVAAGHAGNAVWISFLIAALVALCTGLSYAELSSMFRGDAAEYDYLKSAAGKKLAFLVALSVIAGTIMASATVALGFAGYLSQLVNVPLIGAAIGIILFLAVINAVGIRQASWFNVLSTSASVFGLLVIVLLGLFYPGQAGYFHMPKGAGGLLGAAALIFFAFIGFEAIVKLRDETKKPAKTIPQAVILSIIISSVLYVLVALASVKVLGWEALRASTAPLASVAEAVLGSKAFVLIAVIALLSTSNTILLTMVAASRQLYGMAKEHAMPGALSYVGKKSETPTVAIVITALFAVVFALAGNIELIANLTNLFLFFTFAAVNLSVIVLRYKCADVPRGFTCPANLGKFSVIALLGLVTSAGMIVFVIRNLVI